MPKRQARRQAQARSACGSLRWTFSQSSRYRTPFYAAYTRAGGRPVDPARVFYWEVLGNLQWAIGALGQARRHLSGLAPSIELAALGRISAEMELELLDLIGRWEAAAGPGTPATAEARHAG